jgi:hypothetical protein
MPFFAAFMMPDIFSALATLAAALLLVYFDRIPLACRVGLALLIVYSIAAHTSNIALMMVAVATGWFINRLRARNGGADRRLVWLASALAGGLALVVAGGLALKTIFGRPAQNPPFILERLIVDGPALAYLRTRCHQPVYVSCELLNRTHAIDPRIIWIFIDVESFTPSVDPVRRERFYKEAWPIVFGTVRHDPIGVVLASLRNALKQLTMFKIRPEMDHALIDTLRVVLRRAPITAAITPNVAVCLEGDGSGCNLLLRGRMWRWLQVWQHVVVAGAGLLIVLRLGPIVFRRDWRSLERDGWFAVYAIGLVVANGVICGVLSGPYNRYQARVIWLVPVAAMIVEGRRGLLARFTRTDQS